MDKCTTRRVNARAAVCGTKGLQIHALGHLLESILVPDRDAEFNSSASTALLTTASARDAMWLASERPRRGSRARGWSL